MAGNTRVVFYWLYLLRNGDIDKCIIVLGHIINHLLANLQDIMKK